MLLTSRRMPTALRRSTFLCLLILIWIKYSCAFSISRSSVPPADESTQRAMPSHRSYFIYPTRKPKVNYVPEAENTPARHYRHMLITVYNTLEKFDDDVISVANTRKVLEDFLIIRPRRDNNYRHGNKSRYRRFRKGKNSEEKTSFLKLLNRILLRVVCGNKNSSKKKKGRLKLLLRYLDRLMILESQESNTSTPSSLISPEVTSIQRTNELEQNTFSSPIPLKSSTTHPNVKDPKQVPLKFPRNCNGENINCDTYRTTTPRNNNMWGLLRVGNVPKTRERYPSTLGQYILSSSPKPNIGPNFPHETNFTQEESKKSEEHHEFQYGRWITKVLGGFFSDFLPVHEEDDDPEPCHNLQRRNGDQGTVTEPDAQDSYEVDCVRGISSTNQRRVDEISGDVSNYVTQKTQGNTGSSALLPDDPTRPTTHSVSTQKERIVKKK